MKQAVFSQKSMSRISAPEQDVVPHCSEGCTLTEIENLTDLNCGMVKVYHGRALDAPRRELKEKK